MEGELDRCDGEPLSFSSSVLARRDLIQEVSDLTGALFETTPALFCDLDTSVSAVAEGGEGLTCDAIFLSSLGEGEVRRVRTGCVGDGVFESAENTQSSFSGETLSSSLSTLT